MALWIDRIIKPSPTNAAPAPGAQMRSDIAVAVTVLFALLLALGIRNQVYTASQIATFDNGALRIAYPERWITRTAPDGAFTAINLGSRSTYDTRIEISARPLRETETIDLARFDRSLKLAADVSAYRELEAAEMRVLGNTPALVTTYAFVADPTQASGGTGLPVVVEGQDLMFVLGDRFYTVTMTADAAEWAAAARDFAVVTNSLRLAAAPDHSTPASGFQGATNSTEGGN